MEMEFYFQPKSVRPYLGTVLLKYDTGEEIRSILTGIAEELDVKFDKSVFKMSDTFMKLATSKSYRITNRSGTKISFDWKLLASDEEDKILRTKRLRELQQMKETIATIEVLYISSSSFKLILGCR